MKKIVVVLALAVLLLPAAALADTIEFNSFQISGLRVQGTVDGRRVNADYVGEFDISWDEQEVLAAYCADLLTTGVGGEYDMQALSSLDYEDYSYLYQAAWIMENYSPSLTSVDEAYADEYATAVQAALWTLFDDFQLTGVSGSRQQSRYVTNLYSEILAEAAGVDFSTYTFDNDFYYATSSNRQDLLVATPGGAAAAPEPGSLLLMGSALMGAVGYMRRRQKGPRRSA